MTEQQLIARKEKHKICSRLYYFNNKAKIKEKRTANKAYHAAWDKQNYQKNREQILARKYEQYWEDVKNGRLIGKKITTILPKAKVAAKNRGLSWNITLEQLTEIRNNPCTYCGGSLPQFAPGLDRINNDIGYEIDNVLPCCSDCNRHRNSTWSVEEMRAAVNAVLALRNKK